MSIQSHEISPNRQMSPPSRLKGWSRNWPNSATWALQD